MVSLASQTSSPSPPVRSTSWRCTATVFQLTGACELVATSGTRRRGDWPFLVGYVCCTLFVAQWVLKMGVQRLVIIGSLTTMLCSVPLWPYGDVDGLIIFAFIWGVANLGLLKIIISLATFIAMVPAPRLISGLLLGATLGTAVSHWVTIQIVERSISYFFLQFGPGCYLALVIVLLLASRGYVISQTSCTSPKGAAAETSPDADSGLAS